MKKLFVVGVVLFASLNSFAAGNPKKIANGKFLFEDWGCTACHSIGTKHNQDPTKGPDLKGVFSRRSADWIKKFVSNPQAMIDSGDKVAVEMSVKFGKTMKTFKMADAEWSDIFDYIKSEGK